MTTWHSQGLGTRGERDTYSRDGGVRDDILVIMNRSQKTFPKTEERINVERHLPLYSLSVSGGTPFYRSPFALRAKDSQRLHCGRTLAPKVTALFGNIRCRRPLLWLCKSAFCCSRKAYGHVEEKVGVALARRTVERLNNEWPNGERRFSVSVPPFLRWNAVSTVER